MASIFRRAGRWRAQVRRDGVAVSETFETKTQAQRWARDREVELDRAVSTPAPLRTSYAELSDIYERTLRGRPVSATKIQTMRRLKEAFGKRRVAELTKRVFLDYAQRRENEGAGPPMLMTEFVYLGVVLRYGGAAADADEATAAALVHLAGARMVLAHAKRLGPGKQRDRRPTDAELAALAAYFHEHPRLSAPMWDLCLFAIASAMRVGEIVRLRWEDLDEENRLIFVRDRKDPKKKAGNDMQVPLLAGPFRWEGTVVDPLSIILRQRTASLRRGLIFPFVAKTVSVTFERATAGCGIDDLTFHDLRHDAISRLFEAGYRIEEVAIVSGHKSWKNLQRYTHLRPQSLHRGSDQ